MISQPDCATFLGVPSEAMDELIEGVCILKGRDPTRTGISDEEARQAAADRAREQAENLTPGRPGKGEMRAGGTKL